MRLRAVIFLLLAMGLLPAVASAQWGTNIELPCTPGTFPISGSGTVVNGPSGHFRQWLCVDDVGNIYNNGNIVHGGTETFANINNQILVDGCISLVASPKYANTSAGINSAIAAAIALGGGIVDASACNTLATYNSEIDVGNASGVPVTLLLPEGNSGGTPSWNPTITDGTSYALKVFTNSAALSHGTSYSAFLIAPTTSSNMAAVCGNAAAVANEHIRMEGFMCGVYGGSPTIVKAVGLFHGLSDNSSIRDMTFESLSSTATVSKVLWAYNNCCAASFHNVTADAYGISGVTPCWFGNGNNANGANLNVGFEHIACVHPGSGASNIKDEQWAQYTGSVFHNVYMEMMAGADTTSPWISLTANSSPTGADTFIGVVAGGDVAASTRYLFDIASGSKAIILSAQQGSVSTNAINDHNAPGHLVTGAVNSSFSYTTETANYQQGDLFATLTAPQTLTNKALTAPVINGGSINPVNLLLNATAPTISTHFNTSGDSISANNGTAAFTVTVGTGAAGSTGAVGLPTATTGWICFAANRNRGAYIQQTGSTTTSATFTNYGTTVGTPVNWTNSDVLAISCHAY